MKKKVESFVDGVNNYYSNLLESFSESILILSNLQKKYPKQYKQMKDFQKDPTVLMEVLEDLDDEQKDQLLATFVKMASIESKLKNVFDLSSKDQAKLASEIKELKNKIK